MPQAYLRRSVSCLLAFVASLCAPLASRSTADVTRTAEFKLATFSVDATIPLGHRCMGILPTKSVKIADPLYVHGFVLLGAEQPIVLCAVDWCEIRNGAYDQWRKALAQAAGTTRKHVLVCSLHQHDAPVTDSGAAQLLADVGLKGELYDEAFHDDTVQRVATALRESLSSARRITHVGLGEARVDSVASNRRVIYPDGRVTFDRGSRSGAEDFHRTQPEGLIDPLLKTISFWEGDEAVLALHAYATHPMSYYGQGEVSSDFVGLARERRQHDDFSIKQIYVSGCSGDVTAGKFNAGSFDDRFCLVDRMYRAMVAAWQNTRRIPLQKIEFRSTELTLDFHPDASLTEDALRSALRDQRRSVEQRILAAMGLSSRLRVASGQGIDVPCVDLGPAQIVLLPAESFVGLQLMAQQLRPDSFVMSIGYGECWPGYIPTEEAFQDGFHDNWLWIAPGSQQRIRAALEQVLREK
ncbi:MAG: hypothetical protein ACYC0X_09350 [Pirellulaceae bacterium]